MRRRPQAVRYATYKKNVAVKGCAAGILGTSIATAAFSAIAYLILR